jgi:membrane protease YdiL (CAAX protease family)
VPWRIRDAVLALVVWLFLQVLVAGVAFLAGVGPDDLWPATILLAITPLLLIGLTVAWVRLRDERGPRALLGWRPPATGDAVAGLVAGIVGSVLITFVLGAGLRLLLRQFGIEMPPVQESLRVFATGPTAPLAVVVIVVIAPVAEELFFRGMLFPALWDRFGLWPGIVGSGLVFGAVHAEPFVIAITAVLGMFLAWIYKLRGTLVVPIVAHAVFNALGVVLIRAGLG